jgi:hypothetical protein
MTSACRYCGCTDERACQITLRARRTVPCWWIQVSPLLENKADDEGTSPDVCSAPECRQLYHAELVAIKAAAA